MATELTYEDEVAAKIERCPPRMQEIINDFREASPRDRLEYLLEFAQELPELPARLAVHRDEMEQVHECQTPVFLHTEISGSDVAFHLDIPKESPTIRGFAGILVDGFAGASAEEILATPDEIYLLMGLQEVITPQRLRGLTALLSYMKRQVVRLQKAAA